MFSTIKDYYKMLFRGKSLNELSEPSGKDLINKISKIAFIVIVIEKLALIAYAKAGFIADVDMLYYPKFTSILFEYFVALFGIFVILKIKGKYSKDSALKNIPYYLFFSVSCRLVFTAMSIFMMYYMQAVQLIPEEFLISILISYLFGLVIIFAILIFVVNATIKLVRYLLDCERGEAVAWFVAHALYQSAVFYLLAQYTGFALS